MWKFSGMDTGRFWFLNIEASNSGASDRGSLKVTWEGGRGARHYSLPVVQEANVMFFAITLKLHLLLR
jgi:hypothetical protein